MSCLLVNTLARFSLSGSSLPARPLRLEAPPGLSLCQGLLSATPTLSSWSTSPRLAPSLQPTRMQTELLIPLPKSPLLSGLPPHPAPSQSPGQKADSFLPLNSLLVPVRITTTLTTLAPSYIPGRWHICPQTLPAQPPESFPAHPPAPPRPQLLAIQRWPKRHPLQTPSPRDPLGLQPPVTFLEQVLTCRSLCPESDPPPRSPKWHQKNEG